MKGLRRAAGSTSSRSKGLLQDVRYDSQVRATRAYLAGFGTSGSLLAGAAVMFVLASAIVAFRGWPQVGDQPSPASVLVARTNAGTTSSRANRLLAAAAARPTATATAAGAGRRTGAAAGTGSPRSGT